MEPHPQYEFTNEQNHILAELSRNMSAVAQFMMFLGLLYVIGLLGTIFHAFIAPANIGQTILIGIAMVFFITMSRWTDTAAVSFGAVVETTGQDITHLMNALDNLRKLYVVISATIKVYLVMAVLGLIIGMIVLLTIAFRG